MTGFSSRLKDLRLEEERTNEAIALRRGEEWLQRLERFESCEDLLDCYQTLLMLRGGILRCTDMDLQENLRETAEQLTLAFHRAIEDSSENLRLASRFHHAGLSPFERELALIFIDQAVSSGAEATELDAEKVARRIDPGRELRLAVLRAMDPDGAFAQSGILDIMAREYPMDIEVCLDPELLEETITNRPVVHCWQAESQDELIETMPPLWDAYRDRSEALRRHHSLCDHQHEVRSATRRIDRYERKCLGSLRAHPDWPLARACGELDEPFSRTALFVLLAQERGSFNPDDRMFSGEGLSGAISQIARMQPAMLRKLGANEKLRRLGFIRVCGGNMANIDAEGDPADLAECQFELTDSLLERLELKRRRRKGNTARKPLMRMEQLVLDPALRESLEAALAQLRHHETLFRDWGLSEVLAYGRAVTLLFSGPPGTGKTACAEALAHELQRRILVVNYAEIQSMWVGQTEKNIHRLFSAARDAGAVLFFDEADAMFFDRDDASRSWEVRAVNVLLQELERFEGVCILATNRRASLDKALSRRITMKLEFQRPARPQRFLLWQKMLPDKLPLEKDVDLHALSGYDLSGGEIKNVLLNASRRALLRGPEARLNAHDFDQAIALEQERKQGRRERVGF